MACRPPVSANGEQRRALVELGRSRDRAEAEPARAAPPPRGGRGRASVARGRARDRAEADRARAILLTLAGWTSPDIAAAFGVREDTVRLWRSAVAQGGRAGERV